MLRWEAMLFRKKGERLGVIEARDEKDATAKVVIKASSFLSTSTAQTARSCFAMLCKLGLEGIVAKRRDRPYWSGRTTDGLKIRNLEAPAVTRLLEE